MSVIVPVLDEALRLPRLLARLASMPVHEVIVVDGGSQDGTVALAQAAGVHVIRSAPGRARQLNRGAASATGDVLWFLHADAEPPDDGIQALCRVLTDDRVVGGAFWLHTVPDGGRVPLGPLLRIADVRSRCTRLPYGDQGIFCRRQAFEAVGGFPDQPLLEDHALSVALWQQGSLVTVHREIRVSGRRFERRPVYYLLVMNTFPLLRRLGVSLDTLARWYPHER